MEEEAQPSSGSRISMTSRGYCIVSPLPVQPPSPVTLSRDSSAGCGESWPSQKAVNPRKRHIQAGGTEDRT